MSYEVSLELIPVKEEKLDVWLSEFYKAVAYSMFLAHQENDTSLRQAYIMLDNAVEQFLVGYIRTIKSEPKKEYFKFHEIISETKHLAEKSEKVLNRINEYHNTRNVLYHKSVYVSVSLERYKDYLEDVKELCLILGFTTSSEKIYQEFSEVFRKTFSKQSSSRYESQSQLEDLIKDNFGISPGIYQGDIMLASPRGYTLPALKNFKLILQGILSSEEIDGKSARILELIESNEKNPFHSFLISHINSYSWYCFVECFWSEYGEGNRREIKEIRKLIEEHKEKIVYKQDYVPRRLLESAFDPYYVGRRQL